MDNVINNDTPQINAEPVSTEQTPQADAALQKSWYVLQTYSGQENKVKLNIEKTVQKEGLQEKVGQVLIPEESTIEIVGGKKREITRRMYPGYVFIEMLLDEHTWYFIRQTPGVARFIGSKVQPTPVSDREIQRVLKQMGMKEEQLEVAFEKGEAVRVISGAFRGYTGSVDEVNLQRSKLKILINIFGRDTPVEVDFDQAEKVI